MNYSVLLTSVLEMTVVSSVIVLIVMLMRKTAGRLLPKGFIFALWGVVILKLLVPMSIPSPTSVYNVVDVNKLSLIEAVSTTEAVNDIPPMPIVTIPVTDPSAESSPSAPVVGEVIPDSYPNGIQQSTPQQSTSQQNVQQDGQQDVQTVPETLPNTVTQSTEPEASHKKIDAVSVIGTVYCTVTAALMVAGIIAYSITALRISRAETVTDERIRAILDSLHGGKNIAVKSLRKNRSIMIFGIIRPTVVVPEDHNTLNDRELTYLLMHEYQHYRHFDMLWNLLMLAAVCVHWFNPLVYVARRIFLCDMETACDARVLKNLPENEKTDFAETLVSFAQRGSTVFAAPVMGFGKRNVKERVLAVVKYKKTGVIAAILSTAVIITVIAVFATGASIKDAAEAIEEITTDEAIEPEESTDTAPEETEPEQTETATTEVQTEGETEPEEAPEIKTERVSTTLASWRTDMTAAIDRLGADSSFELAISDAEDTVLTVKTENGIASVTEVYFKGASYPIEFSDELARYPIKSNLDVTYAGGFVSVGLRGNLGSYYVFMDGGFSKLERDDSVGYYVWSDGADLHYMKQSLDFEFISSGMDVFVSAYKSPDQFYIDFGKIVSADGGKLTVTQTSWTVQDYFMSDSFVMAEERDEYAYDSVEAFVSDYIAGQLGKSDFESEEETDEPAREEPPTEVPNFGFSADNIDLVFAVNRLKDKIDYGSQIEDLREHMSLLAVNSESEAHKAMRIGSKSELDEFLKTVKEIAPLCFDECSFEKYDEAFFEDFAIVVLTAVPSERYVYDISLTDATLSGRSMNFELRLDETLVIDPVEYDPVGIMNGMHHVNTPTRRFPTEYSIAMYFVCVNRDAFEYADCISITEDRRIIPNEYLYRDGEYQWVESYRNAPKADMIWARANMKAIIERYADNADRLGSYVNQFPIKVFETYDELYDFIFKITPYEGNIDVIYQLIENYDREYFKKYCLVVAVGNEKRSDETTDETDVEFYYEIKDGEMTVYVNDVVGKWYGRAFCRFYDIPREDLAAVNRYSCQYDAESWNGE